MATRVEIHGTEGSHIRRSRSERPSHCLSAAQDICAQIEKARAPSFGRPAQKYALKLELLSQLGILTGRIFYPSIGNDYFPAYFGRCFGINLFHGLGKGGASIKAMETEAIERKGLNPAYRMRKINLTVLTYNNFNVDAYAQKILAEGSVDVLFFKGLRHWVDYYDSFPGGGELSMGSTKERELRTEQMEVSIRELIGKLSDRFLRPGGYIVIADHRDLPLAAYILGELKFTDYLQLKVDEQYRKALWGGEGHDSHLGEVGFVDGNIPIMVLQKPQLEPSSK